jgi:site-specific recombinase
MRLPHGRAQCPKCDDQLSRQSTGAVLTVDIAHQGERVHEALSKLSHWCGVADQERASGLRLIVGSGLIREAIFAELRFRQLSGEITHYSQDGQNQGAILVRLR